MKYRPLGGSGIQASVVGFGAWAVGGWMWGGTDEQESVRALRAAIDRGMNLIDTAPVYGFGRSERIVAAAIEGRREDVVLATKCGLVWCMERGEHFFDSSEEAVGVGTATRHVYRYLGPESIREEVEQSLRRLRTDYIDLYQTHWQDRTTDIDDTMNELMTLRQEGKIRAIGVSNVTVEQLEKYRLRGPVDTDQERYSMLDRKPEENLLPYGEANGVGFLAYSPLARGLLTGKMQPGTAFQEGDQRRGMPRFAPENIARAQPLLEALEPVALEHRLTLAQLAIGWAIAQPGCTHALVGARTPQQAVENAAAGRSLLPEETVAEVNAILAAHAGGIA